MADCQWINSKFVDFYKIKHCPVMREGEGSILGTFELKKLLKLTFSFLFVITQHIKELVSRKFSGLLRIKCGERIKRVKCFQNGGGGGHSNI